MNMSGKCQTLIALSIFLIMPKTVFGDKRRLLLNPSSCEPETYNVNSLDTVFVMKPFVNKTDNMQVNSRGNCVTTVVLRGSGKESSILIRFQNNSQISSPFNATVTILDSNRNHTTILLPNPATEYCVIATDGLFEFEVNMQLYNPPSGPVTLFQTLGVDQCSTEEKNKLEEIIRYSDVPDSPKQSTSKSEPKKGKTGLDAVIISGVSVALVIGVVITGLAIRRWIRNSVVEERRQSIIRVNSQGSHTRSTSNSGGRGGRSSDSSCPVVENTYGSVRVGGRIPSSEDDSDLFPDDSKSIKTVVEEV